MKPPYFQTFCSEGNLYATDLRCIGLWERFQKGKVNGNGFEVLWHDLCVVLPHIKHVQEKGGQNPESRQLLLLVKDARILDREAGQTK